MEPEKVRAPNIRDVARLAGVSYQTVSRVLNEHPSIRDTTKQRVLDVIRDIGYRPNQAARALVTSRSRTIGVLTSQNAHYGPTTSVTAIEHAAREAGYRITVTSVTSSDYPSIKAALDHLLMQSIEALVVIAPQVRVLEAIRELHIDVPYVTLQNANVGDSDHSMSIDQVAGARLVSFAPISIAIDGLGLNVTAFSYHGTMWICAVACRDMLPDPAFFADCLRNSFAKLEAAAAAVAAAPAADAGTQQPKATVVRRSKKQAPRRRGAS